MKLQDLTEKQVVQTTNENHKAFMKLLDKEGFKWHDGDSYLKDINSNKYHENRAFNVKRGTHSDINFYIENACEIIQASKFLEELPQVIEIDMSKVEKWEYFCGGEWLETSSGSSAIYRFTLKDKNKLKIQQEIEELKNKIKELKSKL